MTEDDRKLEILLAMETSLLKASELVREMDLSYNINTRIKFMMNLWQEFYGEPHPIAKEFEFLKK
jgi:hypothetical protein